MESTQMYLPAGITAGSVIGRGGSNIRHLQSSTGARLIVDNKTNCIKISGSKQDVAAAKRMIEKHFAAQQSSTGSLAYGHPLGGIFMESTQVYLPAGITVASVIGRGGSNIRHLQSSTGARLIVDNKTNCIKISGSKQAVAAAKRMIDKQFAAQQSSTGSLAYGHPSVGMIILSQEFGSSNVKFVRTSTKYFKLDVADRVSARASSSASETSITRVFYTWRELQDDVFDVFIRQARIAQGDEFGESKVRFNIGSQLFYEGARHQLVPQEAMCPSSGLSKLSIGKGRSDALCAKFRNEVELAEGIAALERAIVGGELKFKSAPDKTSISCYLKDRDLNTGITVRLVEDGAAKSSFKVDKIKLSSVTLCFLSVTHPGEDTIDFRLKLIEQVALSSETKQWSKVVSEELLSAVGRGEESARGARLQGGRVVIDSIRRKTKKMFEGEYKGDSIRLSITRVDDENGEHYEVAGSSAALSGRGMANRKNLERVVSFCSELRGL